MGKKVYVSGTTGISCLDMETGDLLWTFKDISLGPSFVLFDGYVVMSSNFRGFIDYAQSQESALPEPEQEMKRLLCLNGETGECVWEFHADGAVPFFPAYSDHQVFINDESRNVYCLNARTGKVIWKTSIEWASSSSLSLDGKRIFVGTEEGIICLDVKTGRELWKFECDSVHRSLTVTRDKIFFPVNEVLYCLDARKGDLLWEADIESPISTTIVGADTKVILGTARGTLNILAIESGKICDIIEISDSPVLMLAVSDGKLFVWQQNGWIYCFGWYWKALAQTYKV
ncbi:MAG: PQQ-binding-like beta-propeller repeat protein [Candidatus Methanofastidiosia archaeon]